MTILVFSCSNDTTIKIWNLTPVYEQSDHALHVKPIATLHDDSDYVRAIAYSNHLNTLYSIADNGVIRLWDINCEKLISEYSDHNVIRLT